MNLTAILATISLAFGIAGGFYTAWEIQGSKIDNLKATYDTARMDSERTAFRQSERNSARLSAAQSQAAARIRANSVAAAGAGSAVVGLRYANAAALRAARSSLSASTANAEKLSELLNTCSARYTAVATDTDSWENSAITHHDGWPSNAPAK
jgi:hypothetical protein